MKCYNCNSDFEGNFCPKCGAPADNAAYIEENPYEQDYEASNSYQSPADYSQNYQQQYTQPVNHCQQTYAQPQHYVPQVPKSGMTGGKIAALIVGIVFGILLFFFALPIGCFVCIDAIDSEISHSTDTSYHGMGSSVRKGNFVYAITSCTDSDEYDGKKAKEGKKFITINFEVSNPSSNALESSVDLTLYADDYVVEETDSSQLYYEGVTLYPNKKNSITLVYEIPENTNSLELFVEATEDDDLFRQYDFTFTIK